MYCTYFKRWNICETTGGAILFIFRTMLKRAAFSPSFHYINTNKCLTDYSDLLAKCTFQENRHILRYKLCLIVT